MTECFSPPERRRGQVLLFMWPTSRAMCLEKRGNIKAPLKASVASQLHKVAANTAGLKGLLFHGYLGGVISNLNAGRTAGEEDFLAFKLLLA